MSDAASAVGHRRRRCARIAATMFVPGLAAAVTTLLSLHGPQRFLDSGSYAAVIDSMAHGHGITSSLVPSFSHFSAAEFLARGGRVPFVDFPLGYPMLATVIAVFVGAHRAMMMIAIASSAAIAGLVIAGRSHGARPRSRWHRMAGAAVAVGVVVHPAVLATTRAGLSEPLFIALVLASAVLSLRSLDDAVAADGDQADRLPAAVLLVGAAALVRFVGLAAIVVPAVLLVRRRGVRRSWGWIIGACTLPAVNALWAAGVGGGHQFAIREITSFDLRITTHSVTGWFVNHYASYASVLRNGPAPLWAVLLGTVWMVCAIVALVAVLTGREWLPRSLRIPLAMSAALTLGLYLGMLCFDSLVTPDVRLMAPAGVLTLVGLFWWLAERLDGRVVVAVVAAWVLVALAPWRMHTHSPQPTPPDLAALVSGASIVVSDGADLVWWETGVPSVYLPLPTRLLTGEQVDRAAELLALPCLLAQHDGIILLVPGPFVDTSLHAEIAALAESGVLLEQRVAIDGGELLKYTPTEAACVSDSSPAGG